MQGVEALYEAYRNAIEDKNVEHAVEISASIAKVTGTEIDDTVMDTVQSVVLSDGYCPCVSKRLPSTVCPCIMFRSNKKCICGLFVQGKV